VDLIAKIPPSKRPLIAFLFLALGNIVALAYGFVVRTDAVEGANRAIYLNCLEIEELKRFRREAAWADFNDSRSDAAALGIPYTEAVKMRQREQRDEVLRRYHAERCPRKPIENEKPRTRAPAPTTTGRS
jgi:hypothetical protein